jgi:hypothetical protein
LERITSQWSAGPSPQASVTLVKTKAGTRAYLAAYKHWMYLDAALADDYDDEVDQPAPVEAGRTRARRARLRRPALIAGATTLLAAVFLAVAYQPLGPGTFSAADARLLLEPPLPATMNIVPAVFHYRLHADTSYETLVSVRNDGPFPITLAGIDEVAASGNTPLVRPVELRLLPPGSRSAFGDWDEAEPWHDTTIASGQQVNLWVRWESAACPPRDVLLQANASASVRSLPLRWSVAGIPRRTALDLGYTVRFEVTPQTFTAQCYAPHGVRP